MGKFVFGKTEREEELEERSIAESLREIVVLLRKFLLSQHSETPFSFIILQVQGDLKDMGQIKGITQGSKGTFVAVATAPPGAVVPPGSTLTWTSDDASAVLSPTPGVTDGSSIDVSIPTGDTGTGLPTDSAPSLGLTFSAAMPSVPGGSQGAPVTVTQRVPILPAQGQSFPNPVPTAFDFSQTA